MTAQNQITITELRIGLLDTIERLPILIEYGKADAKLKREKFLSLVAEGFTEQQALELVK